MAPFYLRPAFFISCIKVVGDYLPSLISNFSSGCLYQKKKKKLIGLQYTASKHYN